MENSEHFRMVRWLTVVTAVSPFEATRLSLHDPDVDTLTSHWTQILGPAVALSGANTVMPTFVAPSVGPAGATLVFDLTVTDPHTLTGSDSVSIHISNVNQSPTANAGSDQTVNEQTGGTLNGTLSSDPDLDTLHLPGVRRAGLAWP